MFGISFEHLLIIGAVLLFFGPRRLPDLGRSLGQGIKNFKDSFNGIDHQQKQTQEKLSQKAPEDQDPHQNS